MAGNSFGNLFRITTFGESHGPFVGVVIDGCPSGFNLDLKKIQNELDRRKPNQSDVTTKRKEKDNFEIISGFFEGKTTGAPITMLVKNEDFDSDKYESIKDAFRAGHADHTYFAKYGFRDWRGGGRSSGRETVARVMAGAVAKQILNKFFNIRILGSTVCISGVEAVKRDYDYAEKNILRCPDKNAYNNMLKKVKDAQNNKDSVGGAVELVIKNTPIGIGEPVFDKLDAKLFYALKTIGAVKAIGIGQGKNVENMLGSEYNDKMAAKSGKISYLTNNSGGIIGGISNGADIIIRLSVKPTPTRTGIDLVLPTEKFTNKKVTIEGEHDSIIMPRLVPVAEAMAAITLLDFILQQKGYEHFKNRK
jgi:chorismate synthase